MKQRGVPSKKQQEQRHLPGTGRRDTIDPMPQSESSVSSVPSSSSSSVTSALIPYSSIRRAVQKWYNRFARSLPWRGTRNPYEVWVSEIMLQQTTTTTVLGYYSRFLEKFPDIRSLAKSPLSEVFRLWEGLGYYRRAAQLHKAAQLLHQEYQGVFPTDFETVLRLPGIGRYTAGAITSIAFDQRQPILEANTIRLHARLLGIESDVKRSENNQTLWKFAEMILPQKECGRFNQAVMDFGSLVCTPKNPACQNTANPLFEEVQKVKKGNEVKNVKEDSCPLQPYCRAAQFGLQQVIPLTPPKVEREEITEIAVLIRSRGKILLLQYPQTGRWAGLWDFPRFVQKQPEKLAEITGRNIELGRLIATHKHTVTRFNIHLLFYEGIDHGPTSLTEQGVKERQLANRWVKPTELADLPLHSSARKLAEKILIG
ncbi:MAG: A/G-specific adenine glycosylase [Thermoguttaceae bacterium]